MKYIITEQQYRLIRRKSIIRDKIYDYMYDEDDVFFTPFQHFLLDIADNVAITMAHESGLDGNDYIIFRNQIKQFIRTEFYEYIKEFWESKQ